MQLTPKKKELLKTLLEKFVPDYIALIRECWENPVLREHLSREDYRAAIELIQKLGEHNIKTDLHDVDNIKAFLKDPWGE